MARDEKIGRYFTLAELTHSQYAARNGLRNVPGPKQLAALRMLVACVLDPLREAAGRPVVISSGYRSPAVNVGVGGSATSQHCLGEAADLTIPGMTVAQVAELVRSAKLPYDQLIDEFGSWVHVSYSPRHRRQFLLARRVAGKVVYTPG